MFESFGGADEHPTIKYNFAGGTGDRSPPSTKHYLAEGEKNDMQKVRESFERKIVPLNAANNGGIAMTSVKICTTHHLCKHALLQIFTQTSKGHPFCMNEV